MLSKFKTTFFKLKDKISSFDVISKWVFGVNLFFKWKRSQKFKLNKIKSVQKY